MSKVFTFKNKVWKDPIATWYFIDLDDVLSRKIKDSSGKTNKLGLIKATATIGHTSWKTTLFPTKKGNYVMSIRKDIRQKEDIKENAVLTVKIEI